ncbi:MAG: hypothetical protein LBU81_07320 [Methanosarcinales archaeon]|nr:hypothetical protein [Methanosarcinales archaeon]
MKSKNIIFSVFIILFIAVFSFAAMHTLLEKQGPVTENYTFLRNIPSHEEAEEYEHLMTSSGTPIYIPEKEMADYSSIIVKGTVKEVLPARWTTKSGLSPMESETEEIFPSHHTIYHDIAVEVEELYKGELPDKESRVIYVRQEGGTADGHRLEYMDAINLYEGEHVILYLFEDHENGLSAHILPVHYFMYTEEWVFFIIDDNTIIDGNGHKIDYESDKIPKK